MKLDTEALEELTRLINIGDAICEHWRREEHHLVADAILRWKHELTRLKDRLGVCQLDSEISRQK